MTGPNSADLAATVTDLGNSHYTNLGQPRIMPPMMKLIQMVRG